MYSGGNDLIRELYVLLVDDTFKELLDDRLIVARCHAIR
jgi:hypothetical protein